MVQTKTLAEISAGRASREMVVTRDHVRLVGRLILPEGEPPSACVVFVHGLRSGKDSPRNTFVAERLLDAGMATLLFDLSGHGESSAETFEYGEEAFVEDVREALAWVQAQPEVDARRVGIAGSSLGATIAVVSLQRG